jgi:hypothetical protein
MTTDSPRLPPCRAPSHGMAPAPDADTRFSGSQCPRRTLDFGRDAEHLLDLRLMPPADL